MKATSNNLNEEMMIGKPILYALYLFYPVNISKFYAIVIFPYDIRDLRKNR